MTAPHHIAVIDIGKTNAKLALVDRASLREIAVVTQPNRVLPGPPWPQFDTEAIWAFLLGALAEFHARHRVDAISITTHGACAALLAADGTLAAPVLDYEHPGPDETRAAYDAIRPAFAETGSPRLALGLNLGAQLHWQFAVDPGLRDRVAAVVTWPQYWGHRLTGVAATDVTSLGCHTDLWNPAAGGFSTLVDRLGLTGRIAPPRRPGDILGPILPQIAARTGLDPATPVVCGIHDSNASLVPHLLGRRPPFSVVSTGTWVVTMAVGGLPVTLDERRDTLINVTALGDPVPSARFMGGREYEIIRAGRDAPPGAAGVAEALARGVMLLPAVEPGSGPFRGHRMAWTPDTEIGEAVRAAALSFYLALMTAECLSITGADGPILVEGPFAANPAFLRMLAAAVGRPVAASASRTGTSIGASMLFDGPTGVAEPEPASGPNAQREGMRAYASSWRAAVAARKV